MQTSALIIFVLAGALSAVNAVIFWSGSPNPWPAPGEAEASEQALRVVARLSALWFAAHLAFAAVGIAQGRARGMFTLAKGCWMALAAAMAVYALLLWRSGAGGGAGANGAFAGGHALFALAGFISIYAVAAMLLVFPDDRAPSKPARLIKLIGTVTVLAAFTAGLLQSLQGSSPIWQAGAALSLMTAAFLANLFFGLRGAKAPQ